MKVDVISVNVDSARNIQFRDLFSSPEFIQLETSDSSKLSRMKKIIFQQGRYYVSGYGKKMSLGVFNVHGKFLYEFYRPGHESGQFSSIDDFYIDTAARTCEILDREARKIGIYNLEGKPVGEIGLEFWAQSFLKTADSTYVFYTGSNSLSRKNQNQNMSLVFYDKVTKSPYKHALKIDKNRSKYMHFSDVVNFTQGDSALFSRSLSDTIYQLTSHSIVPKYLLQFSGSKNIPMDYFENRYANVSDFVMRLETHDYVYQVYGVHRLGNDLYFQARHLGKSFLVRFDLDTRRTVVVDHLSDSYTGFDFVTDNIFFPVGASRECFYTSIEPSNFINYCDVVKNNMSGEDWKQYLADRKDIKAIYETIKLTDNPIIMKFCLK